MINPDTGAGFDAPTPEAAYDNAPGIITEFAWVLRQNVDRLIGEPVSREFWLRKAAVLDRIAIREAETYTPEAAAAAVGAAAEAAAALANHDTVFGTSRGPIGPLSPEWDPSHRPYVRQEYDIWHHIPE